MTIPTVSRQQMLGLLKMLSTDDAFRHRFERNPKSGLAEAGIPADQIATFPADHLAPWTLPDKEFFAIEHQRVASDIAEECMCMVSPTPKLGRA